MAYKDERGILLKGGLAKKLYLGLFEALPIQGTKGQQTTTASCWYLKIYICIHSSLKELNHYKHPSYLIFSSKVLFFFIFIIYDVLQKLSKQREKKHHNFPQSSVRLHKTNRFSNTLLFVSCLITPNKDLCTK